VGSGERSSATRVRSGQKGMPPNNDAGPSHDLLVSCYLFGMQASLYVLVDMQPARSVILYVIIPLDKGHNDIFFA
jgi:hypothetical protein